MLLVTDPPLLQVTRTLPFRYKKFEGRVIFASDVRLHIYASFPCFCKTSYIWNVSAQCVHFACKCTKMRVSVHVKKLVHLGRVARVSRACRVVWWARKPTSQPVDNSVENFPCGPKNLSCPPVRGPKNLLPRWLQGALKTSLGLRGSAKPCSMVLHLGGWWCSENTPPQ